MEFQKIAPYLQDPLVLMGFALLLFFGFARAVLRAGIVPQLTKAAGHNVVSRMLLYGFVLALAIIALGFGLKYRELSKAEQERAVLLLHQELSGNVDTINELRLNSETIARTTETLNTVLRHPGIEIMAALFPAENIDATAEIPASLDLSRALLSEAKESGLLDNELERAKFNQAAQAIAGTILRTEAALNSLADQDNVRYRIKTNVWESNLPILRKIEIVPIDHLQVAYQEMALLRANYNVSVSYSLAYVEALQSFFDGSNPVINEQNLASVLAAERIFMTTLSEFDAAAEDRTKDLQRAIESLEL